MGGGLTQTILVIPTRETLLCTMRYSGPFGTKPQTLTEALEVTLIATLKGTLKGTPKPSTL